MNRKAFGPQLPARGCHLTHKEFGAIVVTSVRQGYGGQPTVYFTTAELWDVYGVKRGTTAYGLRAFTRSLTNG